MTAKERHVGVACGDRDGGPLNVFLFRHIHHGQMERIKRASDGICHFSRVLPGVFYQLLKCFPRCIRPHYQATLGFAVLHNWYNVIELVGYLSQIRDFNQWSMRGTHYLVSVRLCFHQEIDSDGSCAPMVVRDNDRFPKNLFRLAGKNSA